MNKNIIVGKFKQLLANVIQAYGVLTNNQKQIARGHFLHCNGRLQQGQGMATLFAKRQFAYWDRKVG